MNSSLYIQYTKTNMLKGNIECSYRISRLSGTATHATPPPNTSMTTRGAGDIAVRFEEIRELFYFVLSGCLMGHSSH